MQVQFRCAFKHKILLKNHTTWQNYPKYVRFTVHTLFFFLYVGNGKILIIQGLRAAQYDSNKYCDNTFAITVRIQSYLRSIHGFV